MSSVGGNNSATKSREEANRIREEYRKKEVALMRKHNNQVRQMTENHMKEMDQIKGAQSSQMNTFRKKANEAITRRDMQHQKQIKDLQKTYSSQMDLVRKDANVKVKNQEEYSTNEKERILRNTSRRMDRLTDNYSKSLNKQKTFFDEKLGEFRDVQKDSISNTRDQLVAKHQEEAKRMRRYHEQQLDDLKLAYDNYRQTTDESRKRQEIRHGRDMNRMSANNVAQVNRERVGRAKSELKLREGFSRGLEKTRNDFERAKEKERRAQRAVGADFAQSVNQRVDNDIRNLKNKVADLREAAVHTEIKAKRKADERVEDFREAYEKKYVHLQDDREAQKKAYNERNSKDVDSITLKKDKQLKKIGRFYRSKMETENRKHKEAYKNIKEDFDNRSKYLAGQADTRIESVHERAKSNEVSQRENYVKNVEVLRDINAQERSELRSKLLADKEAGLRELRDHVQKAEANHARKLNDTVTKFKAKIAELNDRMLREKRLRDKKEKTILETMKRIQANDLLTQKLQYENRLKTVNDSHRKDTEAMSRRHQNQMDQLLNTTRKA